jgi:hypothetical protein
MFLAGTSDARGFQQWREVNRFVKKGSKGFFILVPHIRKVEDEQSGFEKQSGKRSLPGNRGQSFAHRRC